MGSYQNISLYLLSKKLHKPFEHLVGGNISKEDFDAQWNITTEELQEFMRMLNSADQNVTSFFDTYFSMPRFVVETTGAVIAILFNVLALLLIRNTDKRRSGISSPHSTPYNTLFINLAVANILSCVLSWFGNNVLFLFEEQLYYHIFTGTNICKLFVYILAAAFVSNAFGIVSTLTMLGFTVVQYFAICRPLHHLAIIRRKRVILFICISWLISVVACLVPIIGLHVSLETTACSENMLLVVLYVTMLGANISIALVAVIYIAIISICCRIYVEIRLLQKRLSQLRFQQHVLGQKRAFFTTLILLLTFALFIFPYAVVYLYTLNSKTTLNSPAHNNALIYYMTLLPYLKFLSDPVIYGLRMREIQETLWQAAFKLGVEKCPCFRCDVLPPTPTSVTVNMHHFTSLSHGNGLDSREALRELKDREKEKVNDKYIPLGCRVKHMASFEYPVKMAMVSTSR